MASGFIAGINGVGTVTYIPKVLTKFNVVCIGSAVASTVSINDTVFYLTSYQTYTFSMWGAPNIAIPFASTANSSIFVTALETGY